MMTTPLVGQGDVRKLFQCTGNSFPDSFVLEILGQLGPRPDLLVDGA